jgi:hypothetical protein
MLAVRVFVGLGVGGVEHQQTELLPVQVELVETDT